MSNMHTRLKLNKEEMSFSIEGFPAPAGSKSKKIKYDYSATVSGSAPDYIFKESTIEVIGLESDILEFNSANGVIVVTETENLVTQTFYGKKGTEFVSGFRISYDRVSYDSWQAHGTVVAGEPNTAPVITSQTKAAVEGTSPTFNLGEDLVDADGDTITYTFTGSQEAIAGPGPNQVTFNNITLGTKTLTVTASDGKGGESTATLTVLVSAADSDVTSNYLLSDATLLPDFTGGMPDTFAYQTEEFTGGEFQRVSDSTTDMQQTTSALNGYSRYSQENSDGTKFIVFGTNSTSSTILSKSAGNIVAHPALDDSGLTTKTIGISHEPRWDKTGNFPNRLYFVDGMKFSKIEDVTQNVLADNSNPTRQVIKDFTGLITWPAEATGQIKKIYNDQEGDCSLDCDHWAWMAAYYDGSNWRCAAIVHYQISTDTTHILYPSDLAGTNMDSFSGDPYFSKRPNMVEVSPLGTGIVIHTGRSYTGWFEEYAGTWFDGPHLWPLDLDFNTSPPFRIAMDETHSGWAWADDGRELFVHQDNRRDVLSATYIAGTNKGYGLTSEAGVNDSAGDGTIDFASHVEMDYTNLHFGSMPQNRPGWILISTYANSNNWADNQLMMAEIKPIANNPGIWRICPMYNAYEGTYFDEAPASINMQGTSIYVSQNWGVAGGTIEVFRYDIPSSWNTEIVTGSSTTEYGDGAVITGVEVQ